MTIPQRAALYLRVSTARQAEHEVSIPDQKRQGEVYCQSRGYQLAETYVEPGASATNDHRPEFQRRIEAGTSKPAPFDVVIVHPFSRFFRDHFELAFYVRKLAKNGVKLVSITQEMGVDPMHVMMRQIMALFDEYQSKENARQGCWNGSLPPIGYRVVAAEQRGAKVKKKLEIDPLHADTVRLIYRLALEGDGTSEPIGVKNITAHLNRQRIFTRDGGRWGIGQVHRILTRATYIGRHEFNKRAKYQGAEARQRSDRRRRAAADRQGHIRRGAGAPARPRPGDGGKRGAAGNYPRHGPEIRHDIPRAHPDRRLRLQARTPSCPGSAGGGGREGSPDHGIEGRSTPNDFRHLGRKIGYARRSQFCSELAEREGFEPPVRVNVQLISSQPHSTTLPPLRCFLTDGQDNK